MHTVNNIIWFKNADKEVNNSKQANNLNICALFFVNEPTTANAYLYFSAMRIFVRVCKYAFVSLWRLMTNRLLTRVLFSYVSEYPKCAI